MNSLINPVRLEALTRSGLLTKTVAERIDHLAFAACRLLLADAAQINAMGDEKQRTVVGWPPGCWPDLAVDMSVCREPVETRVPLAVDDTSLHPITCDFEWVGIYRGYLGAPIMYSHGGQEEAVGAVCVLSEKPRRWKSYEVDALVGVARLVAMSLDA